MTIATPTKVSISAKINKPVAHVWQRWTAPEHITQWNAASPDWHCPRAENDLSVGGRFNSRMEAKDGSFGFDFGGTYTAVEPHERISYTMDDKRMCDIGFTSEGGTTKVDVTFDAETENPVEMQRGGWQAILDNFKAYAEKN